MEIKPDAKTLKKVAQSSYIERFCQHCRRKKVKISPKSGVCISLGFIASISIVSIRSGIIKIVFGRLMEGLERRKPRESSA